MCVCVLGAGGGGGEGGIVPTTVQSQEYSTNVHTWD